MILNQISQSCKNKTAMKNLSIAIIVSLAFQLSVTGQVSGIKVFTKLDEAKFKMYFLGEIQNNLPTKEMSFDSLSHKKKYELVITFTKDTIADIKEEIWLLENQVKVLEIKKKETILRKSAKFGRKVGKLLRIGKHDKEEILYDVFFLEDVTNSEYMNN